MFNADAGVSTQVSAPGMPVGSGTATASAAPGAGGPGAQMNVAHACLVIIGFSALALVGIAVLFRRPIGEA